MPKKLAKKSSSSTKKVAPKKSGNTEFAKRASLPIWYAYIGKDSLGNFFEGATDDLIKLREKAAKSSPTLHIVWVSDQPTTYFAVDGYLSVVRKMSPDLKAEYGSSTEDFLRTLSKMKLPSKKA